MNILRSVVLVALCCMLVVSGQAQATPRSAQAPDDTTLLVRFQPDTSPNEQAAIVAQLGGTIVNTIPALHIAVVQMEPAANDATLSTAATTLGHDPAVVYAAPNIQFTIADETEQGTGPHRVLLPLAAGLAGWAPNDLYYPQQAYVWQQINAPAGWYVGRGSPTTVIAIIDTGVHLRHPDLQAKLVSGYDFVDNDGEPMDGHGHGTHVAGLAGAVSNNGAGVAGACPNCRLMPVRVLNNDGVGDLEAVAQGIVWAADHGARVINLSLTSLEASPVLDDALTYAWNRGVLPVCAAGNQNTNNPGVYPASNPRCFTVTATMMDDERAGFANYGPWVALAAPGDGVYSTWAWRQGDTTSATYEYNSGTSMAAPVVAGAAGILVGRGLTNDQLRQRLCTTADKIPQTGLFWQCGRLNLYRALSGR